MSQDDRRNEAPPAPPAGKVKRPSVPEPMPASRPDIVIKSRTPPLIRQDRPDEGKH